MTSTPAMTAMDPADRDESAGTRELMIMFGVAVFLRIAVFMTMTSVYGFTVQDFAEWQDGKSYLWMAQTFAGSPPAFLREYDHRVFPGFPAILALVYAVGLPLTWTALAINWLCSGLAAVFAAKLFDDRRIGWVLATLTPQYILNGSMAMTESLMMALMLGGLVLAHRNKTWAGGLAAGLGGLVRPMIAFSVFGQIVSDLRSGRVRRGLLYGASAAGMVGVGLLVLQYKTGDVLRAAQVQANHKWAYGGQVFDWPFRSLIRTAIDRRAIEQMTYSLEQVVYFLAPVPIVLLGCVLLYMQWRRVGFKRDPMLALCAPWLWANTLFAACIGTSWALSQFQRFLLVALPPLAWAYRAWLPRRPAVWLMCAILSYGFAIITW